VPGAVLRKPAQRATRITDARMPDAADLDALPAPASLPQETVPAQYLRRFKLPPRNAAAPVHIGLWGDSHLAAGFVGDALTQVLRSRGYTVGPRWVSLAMGRPGVRTPLRKVCISPQWSFETAYKARDDRLKVGPDLARLHTRKRDSWLWLDLRGTDRRARIEAVEIFYQPGQRGAGLLVGVDDARARPVRLSPARSNEPPGRLRIQVDGAMSLLKLRVMAGELTLYGIRLQPAEAPDIELDLMAYPSATVRGWAVADPKTLRAMLDEDDFDAVVLAYGTNEGNVAPFALEGYERTLESGLDGMRKAIPAASCLLVGPTDRGRLLPIRTQKASQEARSTELLHYARIHQEIAETQARHAAAVHCGVWRWQAYMGGQGSIYRWLLEMPPLAAADLIHLTPEGYRRTGLALAEVLGWNAQTPPALPFEPRPP
jgi:lysophospholipase L1-like esterase